MKNLDLTETDAHACGCAGEHAAVMKTCACGPDCTCGCNDGKACTCGTGAATCDCGPDCTCGCQDGAPCTCGTAADAAEQAGDVSAQAATASGHTVTYTVTGMTCEHCVKAVKSEVGAIYGVRSVDVDLTTGRLVVASEYPIDFDRIVEAVGEAGDYTVE